MYSPYFDEYQKQFNELQQKTSDWQKKFFDAWLESMPNMKGEVNFSENFDKAISFQEEMVKSYLEAQEKTAKMMLDSQKKFWEDYFERMRNTKTPAGVA